MSELFNRYNEYKRVISFDDIEKDKEFFPFQIFVNYLNSNYSFYCFSTTMLNKSKRPLLANVLQNNIDDSKWDIPNYFFNLKNEYYNIEKSYNFEFSNNVIDPSKLFIVFGMPIIPSVHFDYHPNHYEYHPKFINTFTEVKPIGSYNINDNIIYVKDYFGEFYDKLLAKGGYIYDGTIYPLDISYINKNYQIYPIYTLNDDSNKRISDKENISEIFINEILDNKESEFKLNKTEYGYYIFCPKLKNSLFKVKYLYIIENQKVKENILKGV